MKRKPAIIDRSYIRQRKLIAAIRGMESRVILRYEALETCSPRYADDYLHDLIIGKKALLRLISCYQKEFGKAERVLVPPGEDGLNAKVADLLRFYPLTRHELSKVSGVAPQTIVKLLDGDMNGVKSPAEKILQALGYEVIIRRRDWNKRKK